MYHWPGRGMWPTLIQCNGRKTVPIKHNDALNDTIESDFIRYSFSLTGYLIGIHNQMLRGGVIWLSQSDCSYCTHQLHVKIYGIYLYYLKNTGLLGSDWNTEEWLFWWQIGIMSLGQYWLGWCQMTGGSDHSIPMWRGFEVWRDLVVSCPLSSQVMQLIYTTTI